MKRATLLAAILGFCGAANAQLLTPSEQEVNIAFATLRGMDKVLFRMQGAEYIGSITTPIQSDLFWNRPITAIPAQDLQIELIEARNLVQTRRIVADGRHLWTVDLTKPQYSVARYGSYGAAMPTDYDSNALQSFNLSANGQSALLARMVREIWGGTTSQYRPWIPSSTNRSEFTIQGGATYADPVVPTRVYVSSLTKKYFVYWLTKSGVKTRSLTFEMDFNNTTTNFDLTAIYYSDNSAMGSTNRLTDWKMTVYTGILPASGNFAFTPAAGWRAVAGPRPNGSG